MKEFLKNRSYDMAKMFLNQFAISLFGLVLAMSTLMAERKTLCNVTSIFSILFYLFLLYTMTWEFGFKDKISVDLGKKERVPLTGFLISLCANVPNFIFALLMALATWFDQPFLSSLGGFASGAALFLEGMYTGLLSNHAWGNPLNSYWWMWFLVTVPAMATCGLAYYLGLRDIKFTSLFNVVYPESDREPKKKFGKENKK